jgi:hypothetical protein
VAYILARVVRQVDYVFLVAHEAFWPASPQLSLLLQI